MKVKAPCTARERFMRCIPPLCVEDLNTKVPSPDPAHRSSLVLAQPLDDLSFVRRPKCHSGSVGQGGVRTPFKTAPPLSKEEQSMLCDDTDVKPARRGSRMVDQTAVKKHIQFKPPHNVEPVLRLGMPAQMLPNQHRTSSVDSRQSSARSAKLPLRSSLKAKKSLVPSLMQDSSFASDNRPSVGNSSQEMPELRRISSESTQSRSNSLQVSLSARPRMESCSTVTSETGMAPRSASAYLLSPSEINMSSEAHYVAQQSSRSSSRGLTLPKLDARFGAGVDPPPPPRGGAMGESRLAGVPHSVTTSSALHKLPNNSGAYSDASGKYNTAPTTITLDDGTRWASFLKRQGGNTLFDYI